MAVGPLVEGEPAVLGALSPFLSAALRSVDGADGASELAVVAFGPVTAAFVLALVVAAVAVEATVRWLSSQHWVEPVQAQLC